jgi:FkbM family methyltransferase
LKIRGVELELHHDEALSNHIRRTQDFFETDILDFLRDNFPVHGTILDVGANIGNHSVYFANFLTYGSIIAFEPVPENFDLLKRNLRPYNNIGLVEYAVSNVTQTVEIARNRENMGAGEVRPTGGDLEVQAISIDSIGLQAVTLIKIDVEWHEPQVLEGAQDTIYICRPLILIEDANKQYAKLLPDYDLIKAWEHHKTYLYQWRDK